MSDARLIANTTRACYWRTTQGFVATKPDERPSPTCGAYARLDELMKLKGESAATINRVLRDEVLHAEKLAETAKVDAENKAEDWRKLESFAEHLALGGSLDKFGEIARSPFTCARALPELWAAYAEYLAQGATPAANAALANFLLGVDRLHGVALAAKQQGDLFGQSLTTLSEEVALLRERNANQEVTIHNYRAQRDERGAEKRAAQELAESRLREAEQYYQDSLTQTKRAETAERQLQRLMQELGGLTLSQLPGGAYGGALAEVYCDIKEGR